MLTDYRVAIVVSGILLAAVSTLMTAPSNAKDTTSPAPDAEPKPKPGARKQLLKAFMHKKLGASQDIIEGLAMEDFELIEKGAKQLKGMAVAAEFMVINDPLYSEQADEFRRIVIKMEKAAREKRIDGSTLGFLDMTMSCVECHKLVRNILVAQ